MSSLGGYMGKIALLTGPNMAGKLTVMRMTATGVIMAQLGMFVPAESARLSPVDSILTRMGAYDNMFSNASTLKVELDECCKILRDATPRSFVILDGELGRGTSTYDGMAIAGAVLHELATHTLPLSIFATHYGSLMDDFAYHPNIRNMYMSTIVDDKKRAVGLLRSFALIIVVEATLAIILLVNCELRLLQSTVTGVILLHLLLVPGIAFIIGGAKLNPHSAHVLTFLLPTALFNTIRDNAPNDGSILEDTSSPRDIILKISYGFAIILLVVLKFPTHDALFRTSPRKEDEYDTIKRLTVCALYGCHKSAPLPLVDNDVRSHADEVVNFVKAFEARTQAVRLLAKLSSIRSGSTNSFGPPESIRSGGSERRGSITESVLPREFPEEYHTPVRMSRSGTKLNKQNEQSMDAEGHSTYRAAASLSESSERPVDNAQSEYADITTQSVLSERPSAEVHTNYKDTIIDSVHPESSVAEAQSNSEETVTDSESVLPKHPSVALPTGYPTTFTSSTTLERLDTTKTANPLRPVRWGFKDRLFGRFTMSRSGSSRRRRIYAGTN
ncbi:hypothetical protein D9757_011640 [Collybiopsis confluens]|uniref:DNA mismatch repair proteins mutS family domain-containing protein n=1 Tax=Collybiopsis confluens TaxID=2823264 RepID=A0A8H5GXP3_9AGAR|nr:hypothetical protein D9757_011640 [Collybiopsis confluens]